MTATVLRGSIENDVKLVGDPKPDHEATARRILAWVSEGHLKGEISPRERRLLTSSAGAWTLQEIIDASWRGESLGVLAWALDLIEGLPPYDTQLDPNVVLTSLPVLESTESFVDGARLRSAAEIARVRDIAELWHWRSRTTRFMKGEISAEPPPGLTFEGIVSDAAHSAHADGDLAAPIEDDFPAFGKAYASLSDDEYSQATSIAMERHFALNWLRRYSDDWDETPTDT